MFKVGDKVRRVAHSGDIHNCPIGHETIVTRLTSDQKGIWYTGKDGSEQNSTKLSDWQLVTDSPVRTETVTRRRIVPGVYGRLSVAEDTAPYVSIALTSPDGTEVIERYRRSFSAAELRELARVAREIAEYLDAQ